MKKIASVLLSLALSFLLPSFGFAATTAFTYSGHLADAGQPANGFYAFKFTLFDSSISGATVGAPVTLPSTGVTNGLFTVTLDFGSQFPGADRWLEIAVSSNNAPFITLSPRQALTPTPYAITASAISGPVGFGQLPLGLLTNNAAGASLSGNFFGNFGGTFFGSGGSLTGLNPANLSAGSAAINITGNAATATYATNAAVAATAVTTASAVNAQNATVATLALNFTNPIVDAQLSSNIVRLDGSNYFTGPQILKSPLLATNPANQIAGVFSGNGSALTSVTAVSAAVALTYTNAIADAQLGSNIPRLNGTNLFTGSNMLSGLLIATNPANRLFGAFSGNASGLTNLLLSQTAGALSASQLPPGVVTNGAGGVTLTGNFIGNFSGLGYSPSNFGGALTVTPVPLVQGVTGGGGAAVLEGGGHAGIASTVSGGGFQIYDVSVPANPVYVSTADSGHFSSAVAGGNNGALYFLGNSALDAYSFTNILAPALLWKTNLPNTASGLATVNNSLVVGGYPWVAIYDVSNPLGPVQLAQIAATPPFAIAADANNRLYVATTASLRIYSLANPASPVFLGSVACPFLSNINIDNGRAFAACGAAGFRIYDVSDPANPFLLATVTNAASGITTVRVLPVGNRCYVANYGEGLHVYDISVITNPVSLTVYTNSRFPNDVTVDGAYAYVSDADDGLRIYAVGDVANFTSGSPGNGALNGAIGVTISGGGAQTYVAGQQQGQSQSVGGPNTVAADFGAIGGGVNNTILPGASGATIAGGILGHIGSNSLVSVIGGGYNNSIGDNSQNSVISGGDSGVIGSQSSTSVIAGGGKNAIGTNCQNSTISGGGNNRISDNSPNSTIPGGRNNLVTASYAFAAGNQASAAHQGAFVWADSQGGTFSSSANDSVSFRAQGGVRFTGGNSGNNNTTVSWSPGNASWSFTSDRNAKDHITAVNPQSILDKVSHLPIVEWNYTGFGQRHIGPMAQDFHAQFPLNENDKALNDADLHGVALASIQALNQKLAEKEARISELEQRLDRLERLVNATAHSATIP
ncbi:MAG TPA: tail fiber domain-containing protein [Verrucomicrobiae bacterium]|jgi:hypothetical protein|nr:tail fiber domain-containing protein [Verrucomicrobiae bacterium]